MKMSILKNSKIAFVCLMFIGLMTACQKEKQGETLPTPTTTVQGANFFQSQNRSTETNQNSNNNDDEFLCFAINYPVEVVFPDGTKQSVNSDSELEILIDNWFDANPNAEFFPTFTFPINVTLEDGTQESVADDDELCDLFETCWEEGEGEGELEELCFDFVYPVTVVLPDGSNIQTNNDDELEDAIFGWYDANPNSDEDVTFAYPVEVIEEDGNQRTVNSDDELEMLVELCDGEFHDDCFTLNYPVTILFPDSTAVEVTDELNLYEVVDAWYDANPSSNDDPTFQYPINVTLEDGTQQTLNSEKELEELFDECYGDECPIEGDDVLLRGASSVASKVVVAKQERR